MGAFVIIAATLFPGDALHVIFIKVGLGWGTLWIAAFQGSDEVGTAS